MATRSQILVSNKAVTDSVEFVKKYAKKSKANLPSLYKHWDGYQSGTLPDLLPFLYYFKKDRGLSDCSYLIAQLACYLNSQADKQCSELEKRSFTGFGITNELFGGIEYIYIIDCASSQLYVLEEKWVEETNETYWREEKVIDLNISLENIQIIIDEVTEKENS